MSPVKRTHHVAYDLKYHSVWIPRYGKMILRADVSKRGITAEVIRKDMEYHDNKQSVLLIFEKCSVDLQ